MGASLALSLQAPPGFPDRHCDWQEAGYPQGNPSSRLGDPRCRLLLNSAGNQCWQPSVGGREPVSMATVAASWLGREGRRLAEIDAGRSLVQGCTPVCWGKALIFPLPNHGGPVTGTRFSPMFPKRPVPFKGGTSLEPQILGRDGSPTRQPQLVPEILK